MEYKLITLKDVKANEEFKALIERQSSYLEELGYTEHGLRHSGYVSVATANILKELGYDSRMIELGRITGWIHDVGNTLNRKYHGLTGGVLAYNVLVRMGMDPKEAIMISNAIGNHEENVGVASTPLAAALQLADKSDAHRSRVNKGGYDEHDIHDRVNMSIRKNYLVVDKEKQIIRLVLIMKATSAPMEYLQIYLPRMVMCEKAATFLGYTFELVINGVLINHHRRASAVNIKLRSSETEVTSDTED
ncbi:MAG: phosphohydrolase [Clostridia bacterium]|nr:phosphohydrolase [Clostridia bacterium]